MAIQVNSIAELQKVMMDMVEDAMDDTSDFLVDKTREIIDKTVYDVYKPKYYHRTNYLRDSVDIIDFERSNKRYSMTIGHNKDNFDWFSIGEHTIDYVPEIVTYGKYGTYRGYGTDQMGIWRYHDTTPSGSYSKPRPYMDKTVKALKSNNTYLNQLKSNINSNVEIV